MNGEDIKTLHYKRGYIKCQLTLFEKALANLSLNERNEEFITNITQRIDKIEPLFHSFDEIQTGIEYLVFDNQESYDKELNEREMFQNLYFSLLAKAKSLLPKDNVSDQDNFSSGSQQLNNSGSKHSDSTKSGSQTGAAGGLGSRCVVKLPTINLPVFDGTFTSWRSFYDYFKSLIHANNELSNVQKLTYLKSSLKGEPHNLVSSLETIDTNYEVAWNLLKSRYDNKRRIISNHIQNILNVPIIPRESAVHLRELINTLQTQVNSLQSLGQPVDKWNALLVPIILSKLDNQTIKEWETLLNNEGHTHDDVPTFTELSTFLLNKQNTLEAMVQKRNHDVKGQTQLGARTTKVFAAFEVKCLNCNQSTHAIYQCESFLKLDTQLRNKRVRELKICINCLRKGHFLQDCKSQSTCKKCNKNHHTMLHINSDNLDISNVKENSNTLIVSEQMHQADAMNANQSTEINLSSTILSRRQILLSTALIDVYDLKNEQHQSRVLLDSASQSNFITEQLCAKLNLRKLPINITVIGIGQGHVNISHKVNIRFASRFNNYTFNVQCLVVPNITSALPLHTFNQNAINIPANIKLADPLFNESKGIDILLGAGIFWSLISIGQIIENNLTYQKTKLGWIISGLIIDEKHSDERKAIFCMSITDLNDNLERFWKVDEFIENSSALTKDEQYCENYFKETTTRDRDGKFVVRIPFKTNLKELGQSYDVAISRLRSLERSFKRDSSLKTNYTEFMNQYISLNHMTKVDQNLNSPFYLPHHCIIKESSSTTRLRVVFDGSCKLLEGLSINEVQHTGPILQNDIFSIVARCSLHKYLLTADIEKMYRQVWIHPDERKYQTILWRNESEQATSSYQLNTITYGTTSAPYLAIRCLKQIAMDNEIKYPIESKIISDDFYVDDLITGGNNLDQLQQIKSNLTHILSNYGFNLCKFNSNIAEFRNNNSSQNSINISQETNKTLGVYWNTDSDTFCYSVEQFNKQSQETITKRTILSETAKLYDPLGLLAPIIIIPKLLIQELWQLKLNWDESLPISLHTRWLQFRKELSKIEQILIPRKSIISEHNRVELHTFCDASQTAYGACIYIRSINQDNEVLISLLAAKSRVAPIKSVTLPRLELCAAIIGAQLANKFKEILQIKIDKEYYWSDSTITLCWLRTNPTKWKTYVSNRVSEIQRLTNPNDWYHVASSDNPADLITRGLLPNKLINNPLWWNGPIWLSSELTVSNNTEVEESLELLPNEEYSTKTFTIINSDKLQFIENYSSLDKLKRIVAYCKRFSYNCKVSKEKRHIDPLTTTEISNAFMELIKVLQQHCFSQEFAQLKQGKPIDNKSSLLSLVPFLDQHDLIRVGGRLALSNFNYDKKHPIVLPKHNYLTELIFKSEHVTLCHAGAKLLLCSIRDTFWPIAGRNLAKKTIRNCVKCSRFDNNSIHQLMGNLPKERTMSMYPFHSTGVDYAGPYLLKNRIGRGSKTSKAYICLFICLSTKCIHLELVTDLTTKMFLLSFKRFIARRGKPLNMFSDNATNFVGANNDLRSLYKFLDENTNFIQKSLTRDNITWHFIPARSPSFGGLWEAGVKSVKHHLNRTLSNSPLTYEEFSTVLTQIESILNSRPLTPLSSDPNDLEALTPAHFLIGRTFTNVPDPNVSDISDTRLSRFQMLQKLNMQFWNKWYKEYINELQQRSKWKGNSRPIQVGTMVLLKEENQAPSQWRLGRVIMVHPGYDNIVRVVTIKCSSGNFKRAVNKLCILPIDI